MNEPVNPLDSLQQFTSDSLPSPPRPHSSGRRELRSQILARGIPVTARARTAEEQAAAILKGEACLTLPLKRKEEKRLGMGKKEWKKYQRSLRQSS
jgi:hypothetical protein